MATYQTESLTRALAAKEASHRHARMMSGMRWTLWLSVLMAPCGYATSILLARVGPDVIGTYGVLSLYVSFTSVFLFFGGSAVAIKFIPEIESDKRISFVGSYFVVICVAALPYQIVASLWPSAFRYLFGVTGSPLFELVLIWVAPLYILSSLTVAALKAMLDIKEAQVLTRIVTLGSFVLYASLYFVGRGFLRVHAGAVIWSTYFVLTVVVTAIALYRFVALNEQRGHKAQFRFFLPHRFWRYTVGLQASSAFGFLSTRIDYIFVLNAGGLAVFGRYVALMTLVSIVPTFATFMLDSFLPCLITIFSTGDLAASRRLTETYLRITLPFACGVATFMLLFGEPLLSLLGRQYAELKSLVPIAVLFATVQVLNWFIGTMFSAISLPHNDAVAKAFRTILFCTSFCLLWSHFRLTGAVWAWGLAEVGYQCAALYLLLRSVPFRFTFAPSYFALLLLTALLAWCGVIFETFPIWLAMCVWPLSVFGFLLVSKYTWLEAATLAAWVFPARVIYEVRHLALTRVKRSKVAENGYC